MISYRKEDFKTYLFLFFICLIISLESPLAPFTRNVPWTDSSVFIYTAKNIMNGAVVYRDVFDHKGPFLYLINIAGLAISKGTSFWGIWLIQLISLLTTAILLLKTLLLLYNRFISSLVVCLLLVLQSCLDVGGNIAESWAVPLISASLYIFSLYFTKGRKFSKSGLAVLSVTFTLTFFLRANLVLIWGIFGLSVIADMLFSRRYKELVKYSLYVTGFILITSSPFFLYFYLKNSLNEALYSMLWFNLKYTSGFDPDSIKVLVTGFLRHTFVVIPLIIFSTITIYRFFNRKNVIFDLIWIISAGLIVISCFIGRPSMHYLVQVIPLLSLPAGYCYNYLYETLSFKKTLITLIIALSFSSSALYSSARTLIKNFYAFDNSSFDFKVIDVIKNHTNKDDKILVIGNSNNYYLYSGRISSSKYSFCYPIIEKDKKIEDEYFMQLTANKPKVVVTDLFWELFDPIIRKRFEMFLNGNYTRFNVDFNNAVVWIRKDIKAMEQ